MIAVLVLIIVALLFGAIFGFITESAKVGLLVGIISAGVIGVVLFL